MKVSPDVHDLALSRIHDLFPNLESALSRCRVKGCPWPSLAANYCRAHLADLASSRPTMPSTTSGRDHPAHGFHIA